MRYRNGCHARSLRQRAPCSLQAGTVAEVCGEQNAPERGDRAAHKRLLLPKGRSRRRHRSARDRLGPSHRRNRHDHNGRGSQRHDNAEHNTRRTEEKNEMAPPPGALVSSIGRRLCRALVHHRSQAQAPPETSEDELPVRVRNPQPAPADSRTFLASHHPILERLQVERLYFVPGEQVDRAFRRHRHDLVPMVDHGQHITALSNLNRFRETLEQW